MKLKAFNAIIHGQVQRVSFRYHTRIAAMELGITGWVRNLPNGTVEAWAESDEASLAGLKEWLRHGSPTARVDSLDISPCDPTGSYDRFVIRT
jgi:acylphosphatase